MDATLYLQRLKEEISTLREEKALLASVNDIDVIDDFELKPMKVGHFYSFTIDEENY